MQYEKRRFPNLERLLRTARSVEISRSSRVVIFSDLHMGDGGRNDEFRRNAGMLRTILESHYLVKNYSLVLNGDIEELLKFDYKSIIGAWGDFYDLFLRFSGNGFFWKIYGNHDLSLLELDDYHLATSLVESLAFRYSGQTLLLFHGHQASAFLNGPCSLFSRSLSYILRYLAKPAGIRNYSVSYDSRKRFAIEKSVYEFSNRAKIISVIGHTHRPLFESLSKIDYLDYRIEELCRAYSSADPDRQAFIEKDITRTRKELEGCCRKGYRRSLRSGRYGNVVIPSIFNSGCAIGKRGMTALEIEDGMIRLVYWSNGIQGGQPAGERSHSPCELGSSGLYRAVLNEDLLDYAFSRIKLLT